MTNFSIWTIFEPVLELLGSRLGLRDLPEVQNLSELRRKLHLDVLHLRQQMASFALGEAASFALGEAASFALGEAASFALGEAASFALGEAASFAYTQYQYMGLMRQYLKQIIYPGTFCVSYKFFPLV